MAEAGLEVRRVDFDRDADANAYLEMLDAYARDPMGGGRPLSADTRRRLIADLRTHPGCHCLLAEVGGRAVGFVTCFLGYSTFRARPLLNLHDIAVLPAWRGRAIATRLLDEVTALAQSLDCCRVTLEVRADNPGARRVYERHGFTPAQCSLFMEKPL